MQLLFQSQFSLSSFHYHAWCRRCLPAHFTHILSALQVCLPGFSSAFSATVTTPSPPPPRRLGKAKEGGACLCFKNKLWYFSQPSTQLFPSAPACASAHVSFCLLSLSCCVIQAVFWLRACSSFPLLLFAMFSSLLPHTHAKAHLKAVSVLFLFSHAKCLFTPQARLSPLLLLPCLSLMPMQALPHASPHPSQYCLPSCCCQFLFQLLFTAY